MDHILDNIRNVPPGIRPEDYYVSLVGSFISSLFCLWIALLIYQARRPERVDRWLARTMFLFGTVSIYATYRLVTHSFIPYLYGVIWTLLVVCVMFTTYYVHVERRKRKALEADETYRSS